MKVMEAKTDAHSPQLTTHTPIFLTFHFLVNNAVPVYSVPVSLSDEELARAPIQLRHVPPCAVTFSV